MYHKRQFNVCKWRVLCDQFLYVQGTLGNRISVVLTFNEKNSKPPGWVISDNGVKKCSIAELDEICVSSVRYIVTHWHNSILCCRLAALETKFCSLLAVRNFPGAKQLSNPIVQPRSGDTSLAPGERGEPQASQA